MRVEYPFFNGNSAKVGVNEPNNQTKTALKGLAHNLKPVVLLGANGLTEGVLAEIDNALNHHELIKVKVPRLIVKLKLPLLMP